MKKFILPLFLLPVMAAPAMGETIKIKGVLNNNRYDDGDQWKTEYVGWNSELGKAIFIVDFGIYAMEWDGTKLTTPVKEPAVDKKDVMSSTERQLWATNFNIFVHIYKYGRMFYCQNMNHINIFTNLASKMNQH